jgi:hypothetical protein
MIELKEQLEITNFGGQEVGLLNVSKNVCCLLLQTPTCVGVAGVRITTRQMRVELRIGKYKYKPTRQSREVFFSSP